MKRHPEPSEPFDYDAVERALGDGDADEVQVENIRPATDAFLAVASWLVEPLASLPANASHAAHYEALLVMAGRVTEFAAALKVSGLAGRTVGELAALTGRSPRTILRTRQTLARTFKIRAESNHATRLKANLEKRQETRQEKRRASVPSGTSAP